MSRYRDAYMYELSNATATFEAEFMKKLSNTEAELLETQKALLVKNRVFCEDKLSRIRAL